MFVELKQKKGITLIELLVAVTILSIISASIAYSFFCGMKLWNRAKNEGTVESEVLLSFEKIIRELYQSIRVREIDWEGDSRKFSFPTLINNEAVRVIYSFNSDNKELLRSEISLKKILEGEKVFSSRKEMTLDDFSLSYGYHGIDNDDYVWGQDWKKEKGALKAIRFNLKFNGH